MARVLLFNATGERDSAAMLKLLTVSTAAFHNTENEAIVFALCCHGYHSVYMVVLADEM